MLADVGRTQAHAGALAAQHQRQQRHQGVATIGQRHRGQAAGGQQVHIVQQGFRRGDQRVRQGAFFKHRAQLGRTAARQAAAQLRQKPAAGTHPVVVGDQARVGLQIGEFKRLAKHRPLRVTDHRQKNLLAALDGEHVIHRPG